MYFHQSTVKESWHFFFILILEAVTERAKTTSIKCPAGNRSPRFCQSIALFSKAKTQNKAINPNSHSNNSKENSIQEINHNKAHRDRCRVEDFRPKLGSLPKT